MWAEKANKFNKKVYLLPHMQKEKENIGTIFSSNITKWAFSLFYYSHAHYWYRSDGTSGFTDAPEQAA
jgi:hypothetical protein